MSLPRKTTAALVDSGPVGVLAVIAGAGSFTHIRDTAAEHGQRGPMAWAIAVCIDLTCVMAARERQRDKRTRRRTRRVSWPSLVLAGGVVLSLAANLAQAEPTVWGWLTAATPCGAFLVAVSMLERRSAAGRPAPSPSSAVPSVSSSSASAGSSPVPPSFGNRTVEDSAGHPFLRPNRPADEGTARGRNGELVPAPNPGAAVNGGGASAGREPAGPLVAFARQVADEHQTRHGRPITRDALRARLGVSNQLASDLLRQIRTG